jgi:hypothetical protein
MTAKTTPTADDAEAGLRLLLRVSSDYVTGVGLAGVPGRQFRTTLAIHLLASVMVDAGLTDDYARKLVDSMLPRAIRAARGDAEIDRIAAGGDPQ